MGVESNSVSHTTHVGVHGELLKTADLQKLPAPLYCHHSGINAYQIAIMLLDSRKAPNNSRCSPPTCPTVVPCPVCTYCYIDPEKMAQSMRPPLLTAAYLHHKNLVSGLYLCNISTKGTRAPAACLVPVPCSGSSYFGYGVDMSW